MPDPFILASSDRNTLWTITRREGDVLEQVTLLSERDTVATVHERELIRLVGDAPDLTLDGVHAFVTRGRIFVASYDGPCASCQRRCYTLSTSDYGDLGENADSGMDAKEHGMVGPHVPLCLICANTAERYEAALATAKASTWKPKPPRICFDLSAFKVPTERFWEDARYGDGYDRMDEAAPHGWVAVSSWGRDGWDFLEWPYYVAYVRNTAEGYELATNCEGDTDVWRFPTREEREEAMDKLAFWNWQNKEESWVEGIHPDEIPAHLRGPYTVDRTE